MSLATAVSKVDFDSEVLQATVPVVVDFWAEWCGPCRKLGPELDAVAAEIGDKAKVVKVNVDENPELSERYGVRGIPNLVFFHNGKVVDQIVGLVPRTTISGALKRILGS
jgi:thioredoxin 1